VTFQCLIDDDRTVRMAAFQALECVLKLCKVKRKRIVAKSDQLSEDGVSGVHENGEADAKIRPGIRPDNLWMQYKSQMSESELSEYWEKPFSVNPAVGFYSWPKPEVKLHVVGMFD